MQDDRTSHLNLPKPASANHLDEDLARLRDALDLIDAAIHARATIAELNSQLASLIGAAPATLDTLKELADAIGNDPSFATHIATTIASIQTTLSAIPTANIADGAVTSAKIADGTIATGDLSDGAITAAKIASNAVTNDKVSPGVAAAKIAYSNAASGISANTVQEAIDYLKNIAGGGSGGSQASYTRQKFTATAGQTTFTTSGYTVGYLQVFLNGVLLDITDYTASNGATVVLAAGAAAGDELVTIALDSFAIANLLRVLTASASAPSGAVSIDAAGTLYLSGSASQATSIIKVGANGNGGIVWRNAANNSVGYIQVGAGDVFYTSTNDGSGAFLQKSGISFPATQNPSSDANTLDDYEEGTWAATLNFWRGSTTSPSGYGSFQVAGSYVKIGSQVTVHLGSFDFNTNGGMSAGDTVYSITGLPFASSGSANYVGSTQVRGMTHKYGAVQYTPARLIPVINGSGSNTIYARAEDMSTPNSGYWTCQASSGCQCDGITVTYKAS